MDKAVTSKTQRRQTLRPVATILNRESYKNGQLHQTTRIPTSWELTDTTDGSAIGGFRAVGGSITSKSADMIDQVRIYNRVLSSNEVSQLYSTEYVPAPGAILLDSIGLGFSGWLLLKRKML